VATLGLMMVLPVVTIGVAPMIARADDGCPSSVSYLGISAELDGTTYGGYRVGGLSAIAMDRDQGVYYSLVDRAARSPARFFTFTMPVTRAGVGSVAIRGVTVLRDESGTAFTGDTFDGEGLTIHPDGTLIIASETEPAIRQFATDGRMLSTLPVPEKFKVMPVGHAEGNATFEGVSTGLGGRNVIAALEQPLQTDGWTNDGRGRIRLLSLHASSATSTWNTREFYYLAESGQSVVDLFVIGNQRILILERGYTAETGTKVRLFLTRLQPSRSVDHLESLASPSAVPLEKQLVLDLSACLGTLQSRAGATTTILENIEGITLGPRLDDGRWTIVLQTDDNFSSGEATQVMALGIDPVRPFDDSPSDAD